ncbi:hypothetical protein PF005_g28211 [Phytophthora fragariae]|uniref:Auto-transporter adhesin head GIN domain-containing protein n=1 Tax=Phytophthora fragariae TaxID=53985 RepID=A0A6A3HJY1_9STRA|nr:hypothetical protein PF003_g11228 [Phytophthora fragariae]KAE8968713.1 hypothetical protein PF011_g27085 [Phytophthora fragariae]KAE9066657.1 hypothetical protein PF010_g27774 [Phytophthora fragariae]KAE9067085.1 hypothetical protein PF007_g28205 [Phytophthora fragariae]KAE9168843.1 hypothetical protein PF005_g28211 [Phytophthora fragariae]
MKVSSFHTLLLAAASLSAQATADFKVTPGSTIKAATSKNVNFVKQWTLTASATTNTIDSIDLSLAGNAYVSYVSGLPSGVIGYVNVSGDSRAVVNAVTVSKDVDNDLDNDNDLDDLFDNDNDKGGELNDVNSKRSAHVVIEDGVLVTQGKRAELQIDASGSSAVYVSAPDTAVSVRQLSLETTGSAKIEYSVESIHARSELQMDAQGSSSISVLSSTVKTSQLELDALNSGKICIDAQEVKAAWRDIQGKNKISMPNAVKKHGTTGTFACVASKLPARKAAQITASPTSATGYVDNDDLDDDLDNDLNDSTED